MSSSMPRGYIFRPNASRGRWAIERDERTVLAFDCCDSDDWMGRLRCLMNLHFSKRILSDFSVISKLEMNVEFNGNFCK